MEDKCEDRNNINPQGSTNTVYENTQRPDSSFHLNRLLNFNIQQHGDMEQDDLRSNKTQSLNFSVSQQSSDGDSDFYLSNKKQRAVRDPMSHRIIEKRRRDRMNNCLADLSQLIPSPYLKQGQGRIEKTEIIEMAIKHIRQLQSRLQASENDTPQTCCTEKFCSGYEECRDNVVRYLLESLGFQPAETQNMYGYLDSQLEKRRATLPATCTCKVPDKPTSATTNETGTQADPSHPKMETQSSELSVFLGQLQPAVPPNIEAAQEHHTAQPAQVWGKTTLDRRNTADYMSNSQISSHTGRSLSVHNSTETSQCEPIATESRDAVLQSSDFSETSVTPMVGDDINERQTQLQLPMYKEKREKYSEVNEVPTSLSPYTESSNDVTRDKQDTDSKNGAYKFKNDIKWRFTADTDNKDSGCDVSQYDRDDFKDPPPRQHSNSICSVDYSSDFSNGNGCTTSSAQNGHYSSVSTGNSSNSKSGNSSPDTSLNNTVPAFALHPMGVYYIPLVLPVSQVKPFVKNHCSMGMCHPISIPVSFTGPFHMGVPQVNHSLSSGLEYDYLEDKINHRHSRHGNSGIRSQNDSHNQSCGVRRESKGAQ